MKVLETLDIFMNEFFIATIIYCTVALAAVLLDDLPYHVEIVRVDSE